MSIYCPDSLFSSHTKVTGCTKSQLTTTKKLISRVNSWTVEAAHRSSPWIVGKYLEDLYREQLRILLSWNLWCRQCIRNAMQNHQWPPWAFQWREYLLKNRPNRPRLLQERGNSHKGERLASIGGDRHEPDMKVKTVTIKNHPGHVQSENAFLGWAAADLAKEARCWMNGFAETEAEWVIMAQKAN